MPRALSPEKQAEYDRLKAFTLALASVIDALSGRANESAEHSWVDYLSRGLPEFERRAPAQALAGLRMTRNDFLDITRALSPAGVRAIDASFAEAGLPTLSQVRGQVWRTIPDALKRGRIRNEEEYYVIIARVNDQAMSDGLSEADLIQLAALADAFEQQRNPSPGSAA